MAGWVRGRIRFSFSHDSGRYAREILAQALKTMEPGIDAASAMEYLNQALAKAGSGRREFLRDHP